MDHSYFFIENSLKMALFEIEKGKQNFPFSKI